MVLAGPSCLCRFMEKVMLAPQAGSKGTCGDNRLRAGQLSGLYEPPPSPRIAVNDSQPWVAMRGKTLRNACLFKYMLHQNETHIISHKSRIKTTVLFANDQQSWAWR